MRHPRLSRPSFIVVALLLTLCVAVSAQAQKLTIYTIDVEGGQSTLLVSPTKASLLVDTGWPDNNGRDTDRILAAMHDAGITQIDHVLITHFHVDHVKPVRRSYGEAHAVTFFFLNLLILGSGRVRFK